MAIPSVVQTIVLFLLDDIKETIAIIDHILSYLHAGCAVLLVPIGVNRLQGIDSAVIGLNGSTESAHAIRNAMPLLKKASSVHIASVGDEN